MSFLESLIGAEIPAIVSLPLAFAVVFGLIAVFWFLARRFIPGARAKQGSGRSRQPRLGVIDAHSVDARRKLVLVRRDNVEHLIMIGGPNDLLIESAIHRGRPVARPASGPAAPSAAADSAPARTPAPPPAIQPERPSVLDRPAEPQPDAAADLEQALKESFQLTTARAGLTGEAARNDTTARREPTRREPTAPEPPLPRRGTPEAPARPVMPEAAQLRPINTESTPRPSFGDGSPLRPIFVGTARNGQSSRAAERTEPPREPPRPVIDTADLEAALFAAGDSPGPAAEPTPPTAEAAAAQPDAPPPAVAPPIAAAQPQPAVRREFPAFERPARPETPRGASLARRVLQGKPSPIEPAETPPRPVAPAPLAPIKPPAVIDPPPAATVVAEKPPAPVVVEKPAPTIVATAPTPEPPAPAPTVEPAVVATPIIVEPQAPVVQPPAPAKPREPVAAAQPAPQPTPAPIVPVPSPQPQPALPTAEELARSLEARLPSLKLPEIRRTVAAAEPVVKEPAAPAPAVSPPEPPKDLQLPKPTPKPVPASPPDPFASLEQEMASLLGRTPGAKEP